MLNAVIYTSPQIKLNGGSKKNFTIAKMPNKTKLYIRTNRPNCDSCYKFSALLNMKNDEVSSIF